MPQVEVDLKRIAMELEELSGEKPQKLPPGLYYMPAPKVIVKSGKGPKLATRLTDDTLTFTINPAKVKTQQQLDNLLNECRKTLSI